jgi:MerR family transcriptional regulator, light-induced transcriptional regulator
MSGEFGEAEYSIAAVSKLTGASCHALRVWERRYGFPVPRRSASGHRRYDRSQVHTLQMITQLAESGRLVGALIADYRDGKLVLEEPPAAGSTPGGEQGLSRLADTLIAGDLSRSESGFARLTDGLTPAEILTHVIGPTWIDAGERWFRHECSIYHERIISEFLTRKLDVMIDAARVSNTEPSRTILAGTVQGDRHSGGILMLSLVLERAGWRVINLGVDLPVCEYLAAVNQWRPDALGLSVVLSRNIKKRFQELQAIRGLPIFVGGRSILNYQRLAREHGLIPLPGPIVSKVAQLHLEYEQWVASHAPQPGR